MVGLRAVNSKLAMSADVSLEVHLSSRSPNRAADIAKLVRRAIVTPATLLVAAGCGGDSDPTVPVVEIALFEPEFTNTLPGTSRTAFPDMLSAPPRDGLSAITERSTVT